GSCRLLDRLMSVFRVIGQSTRDPVQQVLVYTHAGRAYGARTAVMISPALTMAIRTDMLEVVVDIPSAWPVRTLRVGPISNGAHIFKRLVDLPQEVPAAATSQTDSTRVAGIGYHAVRDATGRQHA